MPDQTVGFIPRVQSIEGCGIRMEYNTEAFSKCTKPRFSVACDIYRKPQCVRVRASTYGSNEIEAVTIHCQNARTHKTLRKLSSY